jgi:hypothetical protein
VQRAKTGIIFPALKNERVLPWYFENAREF